LRSIRSAAVVFALSALPLSAAQGQVVQTGFLDRSVTLGGVAYRYQLYVPANYSASQKWPVILFLHGAGERGDDGYLQTTAGLGTAIRRKPSAYPAIIVFPQVPTDSTWIGLPGNVAIAALDKTLSEFSTDPDRVYLTGLSMGGNGTWNLAYRYPTRFAAIVPICAFVVVPGDARGFKAAVPTDSGVPYMTLGRRIAAIPTWIFHGEVDGTVPVTESREAAAAIRRAGGNAKYTEFLGMDHDVWDAAYASPQFIEWLFAQRRKR
jgi:predicted peptidase